MNQQQGPARAEGRIAWLDLGRGISILLVVLYHVAVGSGTALWALPEGPVARIWREANLALVPLRMPLFFLIAGLLAARAVRRPLRAVLRPRLLDLLWPYLLWSLLFWATGWLRYAPGEPLGFLRQEILGLLQLASPYWFIGVLPIFFLLGRWGQGRPRLLLSVALLFHLLAPAGQQLLREAGHSDLAYGIFQLTDNALWYLLGLVLHRQIRALAEGTRRRAALLGGTGLVGLFVLLALLLVLPGKVPAWPVVRGIELAASLAGLTAAVLLLPLLARSRGLRAFGALLGRRTLVIYLVHPIVLNLVVLLWRQGGLAAQLAHPLVDLLLVPTVSAVAIITALGVEAMVQRTGPRWLLQAPGI
ncbi:MULTISPECIES: acyltransferase [unclassified Brachybacterium]|uniref:acyltransferase family protein n=1 Tax=unclassified Brachybacterium TaxID=2623841 RepID=UPI000C7FFCFC|nr:acyltransferase [Brachybacterium sp. UMB0905]PMC76505.1 hypothetical protein CJ197_01730 [Brachybacterium sp. UMB0905]